MTDFDPRPPNAYAVSVIVIAVLLLLAMLAVLLVVLFMVRGIATTL
jgi:hypothetical protein